MAAEQLTALTNVKLVFFRENASVAILAADSKRSFWVAWAMLKNCRSQLDTTGPRGPGSAVPTGGTTSTASTLLFPGLPSEVSPSSAALLP